MASSIIIRSRSLALAAICLAPRICSATFAFGSAAAQDPLPACAPAVQCNGQFCADICPDGTLEIDPWLSRSIRFQYNLTIDRSWRWGPILGTHNGFISRANGFGLTEDLASAIYARAGPVNATHVRLPNQRYGPKDLLSLGVRELELDLWDTLVNNQDFEVVVCHSPVPDPRAVIDLQRAATSIGFGSLDYNPFAELCSNKTVAWAFTQVREWLEANPSDVAEIFLDNRVATWNAGIITDALSQVFGPLLLTPPELRTLFNGSFPSRAVLVANGKRVIVESNDYGNDYSNTSLPLSVFWPTTWTDQPGPTDLAPFPNCTLHGDASWYGKGLPRLLDSGDLAFSPEEEEEHGIVLKPNGVSDLVNCAVNNVGLADVSPRWLAAWVWSWAAGEPRAVAGGSGCAAAAITLVRGSWTAQPCASKMPALCRSGDNRLPAGHRPELWNVTSSATDFPGAPAACAALGAGWAFDVPRDGRENQLVAQRMLVAGTWQREQGVWVNVQTQF
jgi:hypothetical protein